MTDLIREILQTLRNNKLRTGLTGFAVAWGILMLVVLVGMSKGVLTSFESDAAEGTSDNVNIWGGNTSMPYQGYKENRWIRLKASDIDVLESELGDRMKGATATVSIDTAVISTPTDYITGGLYGVFPEMEKTGRMKIAHGRFINRRDIDGARRVLVISESNAKILFGDAEKAIGRPVKSMQLAFIVVGVYSNEGNTTNYAPFSTVNAIKGDGGYINQIRLNVSNLTTEEEGLEFEKDVRATMGRIHQFNPDDESAIWIWNQFVNHLTMGGAFRILNMAIWIIGLFTMLSGIIGVSNIMFVSVRERTHEIGIRRAIGAKPRNILVQIILESVFITALFGYMGIFLGILANEGIAMAFSGSDFIKDPTVDIRLALYVTAVLILSGALAGLFPALRALKIKPVEALRDE